MILTVENTAKIGNPIRLFDAAGNEITRAVWADTDTGEVEQILDVMNWERCEFVRHRSYRPAPLRWETING